MADDSWKTNREAQDATAAWAIPHLRGIPSEGRLDRLRMLIVNYKLPVTPEELNCWCHRYEQPDIASGLVNKDVEGQAAVIEHRAVSLPDDAEADDDAGGEDETVASRYRAEGFRAFAELIAPEAGAIRWHYPRDIRIGGKYARDKDGRRLCQMRSKEIGKGATWATLEGHGAVTLASGETVAYLTSVTIGVRDGAVIWALPEVGPGRIWERKNRGQLNYQRRVITHGVDPKVIGVRAVALARKHAPGSMDNAEGAETAKLLGLDSRQLMHYHEQRVEQMIEGRTRAARRRAA
jgi:hypothetical protein